MTWRGMIRIGAAGVLTLALVASPARAQERADRDCRCVDREGNEIERCMCVAMPDVPSGVFTWTGVTSRARLGVEVRPDQGEDVAGARIARVTPGTPADEAGLRAGDVIVSLDGRHLLNPLPDRDAEAALDPDGSRAVRRLLAVARELEPGEPVEIRYLRDGEERTVTVVPRDLGGAGLFRVAPFHFDFPRGSIELLADSLAGIWADSAWVFGEPIRVERDGDSLSIHIGDSVRAFALPDRAEMEEMHQRLREEMEGHHLHLEELREHLREGEVERREAIERMREAMRESESARREAIGELRERMRDERVRMRGDAERMRIRIREADPGGEVLLWRGAPAAPGEPPSIVRLRATAGLHGLRLVPLNSELGEYFDADEGVLVAEAEEGSPLGLRAGDVILRIGDRDVETPRDARLLLASHDPGDEVRIEVIRRGRRMAVEGRIPE